MDPVRVIVVADDPLARAGLAALLAGRAEVALAGEVRADEAPRAAAELAAGAAVWDLGAPGATVPDLASPPATPVVAIAADDAQAADALRAGARGVLFRGAPAGAIAAAAVAAAHGLAALDGTLRDWLRPPEPAGGAEGLTAREREVLGLLAEGLGNRALAARLGISEHTAKFHVNAILSKLGAESRSAAIVKAARLGLVSL